MGGVIDLGVLVFKMVWRGNCLLMYMIFVGINVFNVGFQVKGGVVFCCSVGIYVIVILKEEEICEDGSKVVMGRFVVVWL